SGRLRLERRGVEVDARGVSSVVYVVAVLLGAPSGEVVLRRGPFGLRAALRVAGLGFYSGVARTRGHRGSGASRAGFGVRGARSSRALDRLTGQEEDRARLTGIGPEGGES